MGGVASTLWMVAICLYYLAYAFASGFVFSKMRFYLHKHMQKCSVMIRPASFRMVFSRLDRYLLGLG
jgi:hypothetical protein